MRSTSSGVAAASNSRDGDELDLGRLVRARAGGWRWSRVKCGGRRGAEDLEVGGRAVDAGGVGQPVAVGEVAAVALVADGGGAGAEHVAVAEAGALEEPVVGPVDRVAAGAGGDPLADAVVAAAGEAHAGHVVLGPLDQVVATRCW